MGLETIQAQIKAMYGQLTMQRQVAVLHEAMHEDDGLKKTIGTINKAVHFTKPKRTTGADVWQHLSAT
jgi:uncharacterized protein YbaP (TraB family)